MEFLNKHTMQSIDIQYAFDLILPRTPYGVQMKRHMKPFKRGEEELLNRELDRIGMVLETLKSHMPYFRDISHIMGNVKEIRTSIKRAEEGIVLDEVELFEIKNFMIDIKEISAILKKIPHLPEDIRVYRIPCMEELLDPEDLGNRTFYIYDCYSDTLTDIRKNKSRLQREIEGERKRIVSVIEKEVGVIPRISGELTVQKNNVQMLEKARNCIYLSEEASTILTVTFKMKKDDAIERLYEEMENLKLDEECEEYQIKEYLSNEIADKATDIYDVIDKLSKLDFIIAKARFANTVGGIRPEIHNNISITVKDGRHIKLESVLKKKGKAFTPASFTISHGVTVITGANMGGKTVSLKLAGMLTAMAQYGIYVPAKEFKTCLFDFIYFSIGDMQSIDSGLSTFGAEVSGMIDILKYSQNQGLILIDELARGTNPKEGYAISRAIVRYLKDKNSITLFTTHFEGITMEEGISHLQVRGLKNVDFKRLLEKIKDGCCGMELVLENMDYSLERVEGIYEPPKDAINIARLMGLDDIILNWAENIMITGKEE